MDEITCLEEEEQLMIKLVAGLEQQAYLMRLDASDKDVLASKLEMALRRVEQLEREREEVSCVYMGCSRALFQYFVNMDIQKT